MKDKPFTISVDHAMKMVEDNVVNRITADMVRQLSDIHQQLSDIQSKLSDR